MEGKVVNVWFSGWFSALAITLKSIRNTFGNRVNIITSHKNKLCAYKDIGDKFILEDDNISAQDYIDWAIQVCKDNNINVFIPKRFMLEVAHNAFRFEEIGTKVLNEDYGIMQRIQSKSEVYKELKQLGYQNIPYYKVVKGKKDLIDGDNDIFNMGRKPCIKYDCDEGANSFRVLEHSLPTIDSLDKMLMNIMQYDEAERMIGVAEELGKLKPLIMMEILNGPEVSVDCYNSRQFGFVAIPRFKMGNRIKEVRLNNSLIENARELQKIYGFKSVWNAQYRWDKSGNLMLLEINTRMSGGIHLSSMCGFSIPVQWVAESIGENTKQSIKNMRDCVVTQYETPIIV